MNAHLENFRALKRADIEISRIALIAGLNAEGKTALLQGIAAVTGDSVEFFELRRKEDAAALVHDGTEQATVHIIAADGEAGMSWPECKLISKGTAPYASRYATGIVSVATLPPAERAAALEPYLKSLPQQTDLEHELGTKFEAAAITRLWKRIEQNGWDAVQQEMEDKRLEAGREWRKVTGEAIGSRKARTWAPEGWRDSLDDFDEARLELEVAEGKRQVEDAISSAAVSQADHEHLAALVADLPAREKSLSAARQVKASVDITLQAAEEKYRRLYRPPTKTPLVCAHCGGLNALEGDLLTPVLKKFQVPSDEQVAKINAAITEAKEAVTAAQAERDGANQLLADAEAAYREAAQAQVSLVDKQRQQDGAPQTVDVARMHLLQAEKDLRVWQQMQAARKHAQNWIALDLVVDMLAPTGLRQKMLAAAVEKFNLEWLAPASATAGWTTKRHDAVVPGIVALDPIDLGVTYGGRDYKWLSKSDQLKVRTTLQLVQAQIDGSVLVLIDEAEMLVPAGRNQLFKLLLKVGIPAVVAMTWSAPGRETAGGIIPAAHPWDRLPDLAKAGVGITYWIDGAVVYPLGEVLEKAAA